MFLWLFFTKLQQTLNEQIECSDIYNIYQNLNFISLCIEKSSLWIFDIFQMPKGYLISQIDKS